MEAVEATLLLFHTQQLVLQDIALEQYKLSWINLNLSTTEHSLGIPSLARRVQMNLNRIPTIFLFIFVQ